MRSSSSGDAMVKTPKKIDEADERSPAETERVADATLKRLLSTPPKPHKEMVGKRSAGAAKGKAAHATKR